MDNYDDTESEYETSDDEDNEFTCDYCMKGGAAMDCAESIDNVFLHDKCITMWEETNQKVFERKEEKDH